MDNKRRAFIKKKSNFLSQMSDDLNSNLEKKRLIGMGEFVSIIKIIKLTNFKDFSSCLK